MPKLSIIVPVYNVDKYLERCIRSILNQTYENFEIILVNDGSTDNSGIICENYSKVDSRIRVIHKKNEGVSSARNIGVDNAKGKYIGFIDPDDYINKYMYEILINVLKKNNSDMVICDYYKIAEKYIDGKEINNPINIESIIVDSITGTEAIDKLFECGEKFIFTWNKLYKSYLFDGLRYKVGKIYEDEFLAHRILYRCKSISVINEQLYFYVQRRGSIVNSEFTTKKFDKVYAVKDRVDFLKEKNLIKLKEKAEKSFVDYFVWNYFVAYQRLNNADEDLMNLKCKFNETFFELLKNTRISFREKITLIILYMSPKLYNFMILRNTL